MYICCVIPLLMKYLVALLILLSGPLHLYAQLWQGTITDADSGDPIQGVTITNLTTNIMVFTNSTGQFDVAGKGGDKVTFYCPGYPLETHIIVPGIEGIRLHFAMHLNSRQLDEVIIKRQFGTPYQNDSAERRSTYARTLARHKSNLASPVSLIAEKFSKKSKAMFRFQKAYNKWEDDQYTDSKYTPEMVHDMTGLGGDTLAHFMNTFPMPYDYARSATDLELKMWVRYNYRQFLQQTDSFRKMQLVH